MKQRNAFAGTMGMALVFAGCHTDWSIRPEPDAGSVETLIDGQVAHTDGDGPIDEASSMDAQTIPDAAPGSEATVCDGASNGLCAAPGNSSPTCGSDCGSADSAMQPASGCVAALESCNLKDDNCDGTTDEGLSAVLPSLTHAFTLALAPSDATAPTRLLDHAGGGATLLFSNAAESATGVKLALFDRSGHIVEERRGFADLGEVGRVVAATTGREFAIGAIRISSTTGPVSADVRGEARIHTYRHPDNVKTGELSVFRSSKACEFAEISDIAVRSSGETLKVAWILNRHESTLGTSGQECSGSAVGGDVSVWTAEKSGSGNWTTPQRGVSLGTPPSLGQVAAAVIPWPCGEGWALLRSTPESGTSLAHLGERGEVHQITAGLPTDGSPMLAGSNVQYAGGCTQAPSITVPIVPPTAVQSAAGAFTQSAPTAFARMGAVGTALEHANPTLRRWTIAPETTRFNDTELPLQGLAVAGATFGGATHYAVLSASDTFRLVSLPESGAPIVLGTPFENVEQAGPASLGTAYLGLLFGTDSFSLVHTGEAFVLAAARTLNSTATALNSLRAPGDSDPPVAVTYTLGCGP
jgi:hypothetical protein